uniref:Uncharacterized protein n=1 Tax=Kalanchoe fedtschenkoi TaxID=63787 RepID=A0A7N0RD24_KALFE
MSGIEGVLASAAFNVIFNRLLSEKVYDFFSTWKLDTTLLDQLKTQVNSVVALLHDAEEKLIEENDEVEKWAQKAMFAIYDAEDFLDKILADEPGSNKVHAHSTSIVESNDSGKDKINYKVKEIAQAIHPGKETIKEELGKIIKRLEFIAAPKKNLGLKKNDLTSYRKGRLISFCLANKTSSIYGRSMDTHKIVRMLNSREGNDDALRVIPLVGMAGIGKTTLAGLVFHEYKSLNQSFGLPGWLVRLVRRIHNSSNFLGFDLKGWVHVSDEFDVTRVFKSLLESITGQESKVDNNFELLLQELRDKLQGRRFLIVVDDLWSTKPGDWDVLRTCFSVGDPGSRVIVTTRSIVVARTVTTTHDFFHELEKLSRDESWELFADNVFGKKNPRVNSRLKKIGKEIVSRCEGLPLAIKIIGGLLRSKGNDESEWTSILKNEIWSNTKILPSLRLSYYHLPMGVKNCFAFCSIFRKHYTFSMEEVVMLWVGEGLIDNFCEGNPCEDVARTYFTHLCSTCFFQEITSGGSEFVMHNLIHDLAVCVSRGLSVDLDNLNVQSRRLSYIQGKEESLLNNMSRKQVRYLSHLRTLLPLREDWSSRGGQGFHLDNKLFGDLLSNFKLLRVLCLGGYVISKLPDSVVDMKLLRYLDLSRTDIDHLPDKICRLINLQILFLTCCRNLKRLPSEICNLVNLRHLHIDGTNLKEMPDGIGRMKNIRTLSEFVLGRGKSKQMREFKELVHLQGKLHISGLNNVKDPQDVVFAGFNQKEGLEELVLEWKAAGEMGTELADEKVLDAIEAHENLKSLTIKWYGGKRLSDWIVGVGPSFIDLVSLSITDCFNCEALPSLGNLQFLKHLTMERLDSLESFGVEIYGDSRTPFQALEKLVIKDMKVLKTWCFPGVGFQILNDLRIQHCDELTKIPYCFPRLSRLDISNCRNLVKLDMCGEAEEGSTSITASRHSFQSIHIFSCPELKEIPNSFTNSDSFEIELCQKLVSVPRLQHVRKLTLRDVGVSLPVEAALQECRDEVMEELTIQSPLSDLYSAKIHRFTYLKSLGLIIPIICSEDEDGEVMIRLPPNLSDFSIHGGMSLHVHTKILTELSNLNSLTKLNLFEYYLESLPDVELPSTLKSLTFAHCSAIRSIPDRFLSGCSTSLQLLRIVNCPNLACLPPSLSTFESLRTLHVDRCEKLSPKKSPAVEEEGGAGPPPRTPLPRHHTTTPPQPLTRSHHTATPPAATRSQATHSQPAAIPPLNQPIPQTPPLSPLPSGEAPSARFSAGRSERLDLPGLRAQARRPESPAEPVEHVRGQILLPLSEPGQIPPGERSLTTEPLIGRQCRRPRRSSG